MTWLDFLKERVRLHDKAVQAAHLGAVRKCISFLADLEKRFGADQD